ncbi:CapA family protein [Bacillus sp. DNRA2]|uniref:CapA family protein n=1 Tax=Bacillus sp. DNRA2 TaxID=2723053 RepID=UPI00145DA985|nr:CapA family protein [Bacillus sp. DNRA2]NMD70471.1 CapA family protein [Bacillus sp. DNRA2]
MKKSVKLQMLLSVVLIAAFAYYYFYQDAQSLTVESSNSVKVRTHGVRTSASVNADKEIVQTATIGAIGDILIHDWVYQDAAIDSTYDFKPMLANIKPFMTKPDFLMANQETILGGVAMGLSSYPTFNSPQEVGDAFIDAGVDFVSTANNHSLDKGEKGILTEIDYFNRVGLPYVGVFKDREDQQTLRIMNINGIKTAILSYTYGTNGIPIPNGKDYLVNIIDKDKIKAEIKRAKQQADIVVMSIHWGIEYQRIPSAVQKDLAQFLVNEGANIIIGHHPHVLQPMEWLTDSNGRKAFVIYSLGNFLSGQMHDYKDIGGMVTLDVRKTVSSDGVNIELSNPTFLPTYVSNQKLQNYRVVPLSDASAFGLSGALEKNNEIIAHMTQWLNK